MCHNHITRLPWNIHRLSSLRALLVDNNEIQQLPNNLGRSFYSVSDIGIVPHISGRMVNLRELAVVPNPLQDEAVRTAEDMDSLLSRILKQKIPPVNIIA